MIAIEKGIPLRKRASWRTYPFAAMEVGDSFFVPQQEHRSLEMLRNSINSCNREFRPKRFSTTIIREETPGVRCWRIA